MFYSGKTSKSQMWVHDERLYPAVALYFAGKSGAWQYDCALALLLGDFLYQPHFQGAANASPFQRRAGTNGCWSQLGNHNLWHSSQQRPEPDSTNAFSHLHSWEAGGINLFQNVLLVVSQKQIRFSYFFFFIVICILNHSESRWYFLPPCWNIRANKI